jgi:diacylglycerol kinase (ATP)
MPGIGVLFNPKSRRNLRDPSAAGRLKRELGDHGVVREARSLDELRTIAVEFRRRDIEILAISGGDGTNTVTLTGFIDVYGDAPLPLIALLRGGTMNTVASSIGVRRASPEELLGRIVAHQRGRNAGTLATVERHVLRVAPGEPDGSGREGTGTTGQYGFLFGAGVVQGFLAEYYTGEPSPLGAAQTLARGIGSALVGGEMIHRMAKPFRGTVTLEDGTRWDERDYLAVAAGTVAHIGLQFMPFYRFAERPGTFHTLGIYATAAQFVGELPRIWQGRPMRENRAFEAVTPAMTVQSTEETLRYTVDGDLHEAHPTGRVRVSTGPRVRLLVGA